MDRPKPPRNPRSSGFPGQGTGLVGGVSRGGERPREEPRNTGAPRGFQRTHGHDLWNLALAVLKRQQRRHQLPPRPVIGVNAQ